MASTSGMQHKQIKRKYDKSPDVYGQIAAAISAPISFSRESEVSQEVEHFCNFIGTRLNEVSKKKLRTEESLIMDVLRNVEQDED